MEPFKTPFVSPEPALRTPRLSIRVDTEEAYVAKFRQASDTELMAWCGYTRPEQLEQQKLKIEGGFSNYRTSTVLFHLVLPESGLVIGSMAYHNWYQTHRRSEIGYAMTSAAHMNQGYMREALPAVLRFGFGAMNLNRIEAFISPGNEASLRLAEGAGFRVEGRLRQHYAHRGASDDSLVYGLLREEAGALSAG